MTKYRPEAIDTAVARVVAFGRKLLVDSPEQLLNIVGRQARQLLTQQGELDEYKQQFQVLQGEVKALQEAQFVGSVAPFRIDERKRSQKPKKPGRKPGHRGAWRQSPPPSERDEHIEVPLSLCPDCRHDLDISNQRAIEQTIIEAPVVVPRIIRLRTYRNHCSHCETQVSSHHPLQVSTATGAAGTHLGPRALGLAATLNKDLKLTMRKSTQVLNQLLGLTLSPGGLSQALDRVAGQVEGDYEQTLETLRASEVIHTDETGWWVGGSGYTLWVYTNKDSTYYQVVSSRNRATAEAILGKDFKGVLVSDCLSVYDGIEGEQQKCYAHHLKALSKALQSEAGKGSAYLLELRALLHTAMLLKRLQDGLPDDQRQALRQALETRFEQLLVTPRPPDNKGQQEEKVRNRLRKQQDHLFTFLDHPAVDATNNLAERQLRPAVISRKLSCGNKTTDGANTWAILASLAATAQQQGDSFTEQVARAMVLKNRVA
ncbi:MAG: IS66 family transposase [Cyanobacteria bacterium J06650_10]